ncbi:hypothetical protein TTHERM_00589970 (macronuclear) [Tetrahymena thermophila SB210]|uniref:Uncharacterized protein n=1 Tax=Tetrahymena thermophila (strain SB210) TaxID=312017 RepID=I7MFD4_TETTS|nr:hypothetical protein TTHERM_00589970 [Tetrahymena thermophila SB210]EAR99660.1 hypothetical protein TTHERM_00589970 [Tetrahymena thermophila SB210]|eukprot:XP_001019905.1 hypothetical protein TTHERM_00589970 [Tetrahymena thermophila SB210]
MTTIPEEDQVPTIAFPTVFQQGSYEYDNPFEQQEYEIGQIEVMGYDSVQNKGGRGKVITKNNQSVKQIQKQLVQRMQKYSIFSFELIKVSNGTIKKLYLLLYNTTYYSYSQYETFIRVEKDSKLLEKCCQYTLKLHEKLIKEEKVHQIQDKNSLLIMNQMEQIIKKIQEEIKNNQQTSEDGDILKKQNQKQDVSQNINMKKELENFKKEDLKDNYYQSYIQQIQKTRVQSIIIDFQKLLLQICDFIELKPQNDLIIFEDMIKKYLQNLVLNFSTSSEKEVLFQYFKEILNTDNILSRFNLFKTQINSLNSLLKQIQVSYGLDFKDDQELLKHKPISYKQSIPRSIKSIVESIDQDMNGIDRRKPIALQVLPQKTY